MDHYRPTRYPRDSKQQRHHDQTIASACSSNLPNRTSSHHRNGGRHRNHRGCALFPREYPNPCRSNGRMGCPGSTPPAYHYLRAGAREPSESFPRRNGRSGWGPARHHRFHFRQHPLRVHHSGVTRTARAATVAPWRDTFPRHFPEPWHLPLLCALHDEMGMVGQVTVTP